jgi:hypothetical protein
MTQRHPRHRTSAKPSANPLEAIVGHWRTDGHVIAAEPVPIRGTDVYELFPGGHFLIHHVDVTVGDRPVKAIEIIGERDNVTGALLARAYDDNGEMTLMRVRIDDAGVWHLSGGADIAPAARVEAQEPGLGGVRSTLSVAADRHRMTAIWERTDDEKTWRPWMDIRFTRD